MNIKLLGSLIIVLGCGGFGYRMAVLHRREERDYRELIAALDFMVCELEYRLTALPELCRITAETCNGSIQGVFLKLQQELENQLLPDPQCCMNAAISAFPGLSPQLQSQLKNLGKTLGRFDLTGQIRGLEAARKECALALDKLTESQDVRLRSYQTLGLCAGAALAIILL